MSPDSSEVRFWTIYAICLIRRDNKTFNPERPGPGMRPAYFRRISANIFSVFFVFQNVYENCVLCSFSEVIVAFYDALNLRDFAVSFRKR